jgi:Domain of unknown function (DUF5666)
MKQHSILDAWRLGASVACAVAGLISCGGGVDSGGTGGPVALSAGPVSGLGSIIVNGVRYDVAGASVVDQDDNPLSGDALQVGMLARIDASAVTTTDGHPSATAFAIRASSEIIGPVDRVGPLGATLVVLGQSVRVTAATWIDAALAGGIGAVGAGQVVEVWGQYNARTNEYVATRLAPRPGAVAYEIRGLLAAIDPVARTLSVGGMVISDASISAAALSSIAVGGFVRVAVATTPLGTVWTALTVAPGNAVWPDRSDVRIAGRISSLTSGTQFVLDGIAVDASAAAFPTGSAGVALGARVVVTGATRGGVLVAGTVTVVGDETLANSTFEVHGAITGLDLAAGTMRVRGITVNVTPQVQFFSGTMADLANGRNIDVTGTLAGDRISIDAQTIVFY